MSLENYVIEFKSPTVGEFIALRKKVGWGTVNKNLVEKSLESSLFHVVIRHREQLIGMGRVVGDGAMYFYVQDVVVDPGFQGLGIGALVMDNIEIYLSEVAKQGATIGLLSAQGKEAFYTRYGYITRPQSGFGAGMCKFV